MSRRQSQVTADNRIALVISELRPGGMERLVVHLASGLAKQGATVLVICLQASGVLASELEGTGVRLIALESHGGKDLLSLWKLRNELKQFRPSVVNLHDYSSLPYVALANVLAVRCPLVFTAHGLLYAGFETLKRRHRFFSRFLTSISAVSEQVAKRHKEYLNWQKPVQIIANGVPQHNCDQSSRSRVRDELGCLPDTQLFLAVGNPRPEKGFEDLIECVALIRERKLSADNFMVVVAGSLTENQYCQMLLRRVEELNLQESFKFLGFCKDTTALYSAADVFILSSRSEGLPMVILEAMMAGLPVIATRVGGIQAAVGNVAAIVEPQQPEELANAMVQLMGEKIFRDQLAKAGKEHVLEFFGINRMVNEYMGWYTECCKE